MKYSEYIYFDNAASSHPKPKSVYSAVSEQLRKNGANAGRSGHRLSAEASGMIFGVREAAGKLFNTEAENIFFCLNTTHALNSSIYGILGSAPVGIGSHFIISDMEHNSVYRPMSRFSREGLLTFSVFDSGANDSEAIEGFKACIKLNTRAAVITHASNVTGRLLPLEEIYSVCRSHGIILITDAAQTAGLREVYGDIICAPGHKGLYGPQGTGLVIVKSNIKLKPFMSGGTGTSSAEALPEPVMPEDYEPGTLNAPGIAGLGAGIDFVLSHSLYKDEARLVDGFASELKKIKGVTLYRVGERHVPTVAFSIDGIGSERAAVLIDKNYGIALRGGLHCAPLCHSKLGTLETGLIRASAGAFNTVSQAEKLLKAVAEIAQMT